MSSMLRSCRRSVFLSSGALQPHLNLLVSFSRPSPLSSPHPLSSLPSSPLLIRGYSPKDRVITKPYHHSTAAGDSELRRWPHLSFYYSSMMMRQKMKPFLSRYAIPLLHRTNFFPTDTPFSHYLVSSPLQRTLFSSSKKTPIFPISISNSLFARRLHSSLHEAEPEAEDEEADGPMNEFLSRFVHIIRGKLVEVYPDCEKETLDAMLLLIAQKVVSEMEKGALDEKLDSASKEQSLHLSQDLWKTIWEVSQMVLEDMKKELRKEQLKQYLQSEDVKEMYHFASDIGVRGDMLRELRFKWARDKLEESEFYQRLDLLAEEIREEERVAAKGTDASETTASEHKTKLVTLPQRRGKIKYKIYGLDLSSPNWEEVADRIHEAEKHITPEEPKEIIGKCKLVTQRIFDLKEEDDPAPLLAEWVELLRPSKIDWIALLDRLKDCNSSSYFKVAEFVLNEESFEANVSDYSKVIDGYSKENRIKDAERIIVKMAEKGINPDVLTFTILVHMYSKANNLERAKNAFEYLRSHGIRPDMGIYCSMIMAYVNGGDPKSGEKLMKEMEGRGIKPTKEIYMELLRAFAPRGHADGAQKMFNAMRYAGLQPSLETYRLLLEAYGNAGDPYQARSSFDEMREQAGCKPDDQCIASMIAAYEKKNLLDKALNLLLELEKDGFKLGIATYSVLVDWLSKLQLVDEAEQLSGKITQDGGSLPFKLQIGLCDMYSRAGLQKKALGALRIVESKIETLRADEFERVIRGLLAGKFLEDAKRVIKLMQKQGFVCPKDLEVSLSSASAITRAGPPINPRAVPPTVPRASPPGPKTR